MLDLLIQNAALTDGRVNMSVAVRDGATVEVAQGLSASAREVVDAQGQLLCPPFVDAHFHMDATLSYGLPRVNQSGTLLEGIALWGELKPLLTQEALIQRALTYCDWAVAKGLLAIRTHVDVCDPRLLAVEALLDVRRRVAPYLDLQLVAFPQDGLLRGPQGPQQHLSNLKRALDLGVDVVGGIPHFERTMADGATSVRLLCELAAELMRKVLLLPHNFCIVEHLHHELTLLETHFILLRHGFGNCGDITGDTVQAQSLPVHQLHRFVSALAVTAFLCLHFSFLFFCNLFIDLHFRPYFELIGQLLSKRSATGRNVQFVLNDFACRIHKIVQRCRSFQSGLFDLFEDRFKLVTDR